jgi:hypothetical protein
MRYYELDANGRKTGSFSIEQPGKTLYHLDEPDVNIAYPMRDGVPGTNWINDTATEAEHLASASKTARKTQDFIDNFPDWNTIKAEIEAIETAADALTQPTKGIVKDILKRLKKNSKTINWLVNNSD